MSIGISPYRASFKWGGAELQAVFHHIRKWCKLGDWQKMLASIVQKHKRIFDLSVSQLTVPILRPSKAASASGFKVGKTQDAPIFFTDRNRLLLAMSEPEAGNHAGFDGMSFRAALRRHGIIANVRPNPRNGGIKQNHNIFDVELYKNRWVVKELMPGLGH